MIALGVLASLVVVLALIDVANTRRQAQIAKYSAQEWKQRAEAVCKIADRRLEVLIQTRRELADALDNKPMIIDGVFCAPPTKGAA